MPDKDMNLCTWETGILAEFHIMESNRNQFLKKTRTLIAIKGENWVQSRMALEESTIL